MDCPICLEGFNLAEFTPRVFPCGHGICSACIDLLLISGKKPVGRGNQNIKIECPQCKRPFTFANEIEAKSQIGKNFALIAFLEAKIEMDQKEEERKLQEKEEHKRVLKLQEEQIRKQLQSEQENNKSLFDKFRASYLQKSKHLSASEAQYNGLLQLQEQKNFIANEIMIFESEKDMMNTELKKYDALKKPIIEELEQAKAHIEKGKEAFKMKNLEFYFYPECVLNRGEEEIIDQLERGEVNMLQAVEKLKMIEEEAEKIIAQVNKIQMMLDDLEQQGHSIDTKIRSEKAKIERINSQREQDEYQRIMKVTERQTQLIEVKSVLEESKGAGDNIVPLQESQIVSGLGAIKNKLQLCEEQDQVEFIVKGHDCMLFAAAGCQNSNQTQTYYVMLLDKADYQIYIYQNGSSNQLHSQD